MAGGAFTELELQLVLLRRMADLQAPLVEQALRTLGSSRTEMRAANKRWNAVAFGRPGPLRRSRFTRALGPPEIDRAPAPAGGSLSAWPLRLWPGLLLHVLADQRDVVWHYALARAPGTPSPVLRSTADARPWTCTLAECAAAFDDVAFHDMGLTGHEALTCTAPGPDDRLGRWLVRSVWGLVQTVEPDPAG